MTVKAWLLIFPLRKVRHPILPRSSTAKKILLGLFERLPQGDLERRINRGLRPHAFEKGKISKTCCVTKNEKANKRV